VNIIVAADESELVFFLRVHNGSGNERCHNDQTSKKPKPLNWRTATL
jgi:hypothetical protein